MCVTPVTAPDIIVRYEKMRLFDLITVVGLYVTRVTQYPHGAHSDRFRQRIVKLFASGLKELRDAPNLLQRNELM